MISTASGSNPKDNTRLAQFRGRIFRHFDFRDEGQHNLFPICWLCFQEYQGRCGTSYPVINGCMATDD